MNDPYDLTIQEHIFRIFPPTQHVPRAALLAIHGYTGNEHSMEIFIQKLIPDCWAILPRAFFPALDEGFSWVLDGNEDRTGFQMLEESAMRLKMRVDQIQQDLKITRLPLYLMGFSQGAALALVYSLKYSQDGDRIGLMAGFLPTGLEPSHGTLRNRRFFIAHGRQDATIPIEQAYKIADFLEESQAQVDLCESDTGHKLNMACFKRLEEFFRAPSSALG